MDNKVDIRIPETRVVDYSPQVPFFRSLTVVEHTLITNDELTPDTGIGKSSLYAPMVGYGAWYRLVADGEHIPTFAGFKKISTSGDWVATLDTINIIAFIYDGVDYWYSVGQAVE